MLGCGSCLPQTRVTNDALAKTVDTSDEWIRKRTGIGSRYIAESGVMTSHLAISAAQSALRHCGIRPDQLDFIILATTTPDHTFPATATAVQAGLGMVGGFAFDVQAVCAGFIYALSVADGLIRSGQGEVGLVIGAEVFSRLLDWQDRGTCVLFGDGAGALILASPGKAVELGEMAKNITTRGIQSTRLYSDGRYRELLYVDGGPPSSGQAGYVRMNGPEVFRHAVEKMADASLEVLSAGDLAVGDIDWFVPHQANRRIIQAVARKIGVPERKIVLTVENHANTSAASIPLALAEAQADGRLRPGQRVLVSAIGGGLTWGSSLIEW